MRGKGWFSRASEGRAPSAGVALLLVVLGALPVAPLWTGAAMADTRVAMSGGPRPGPIKLGAPELSPDGRLAALDVSFYGSLPRLAVFDLDREDLVVLDRPDNEGWLSPSFSPSGERIAFVRFCESGCAAGRQGFQISVYDRRSGEVTTVTQGRGLLRNTPLFSPDGRSIVHGSANLVWKEDRLARGLKWRYDGAFTTAGGRIFRMVDLKTRVEREMLSDRFAVTDFLAIIPSGFVDGNTFFFSALFGPFRPSQGSPPPLFRELERLVGKKDAEYQFYGYKLTLGEKLEFMSPDAPRRIGDVSGLSVSSDTGRMVFVDASRPLPGNPNAWGFDILLGDGETFQRLTSEPFHMVVAHTSISKMGNRVAFLGDVTRSGGRWRPWTLWVLDVGTGRIRETGLKRRLEEWHRASGGG